MSNQSAILELSSPDLAELSARNIAEDVTGLKNLPTVQLQLEVLTRQGLLVDLSVGGTSLFTRLASWDELGIPSDDAVWTGRLNRPTKNLAPEKVIKEFRSIEALMRSLLDGCSRDVAGFRPFRWLPYTSYDKFVTEFARLKGRWDRLVENVLSNLDFYRDDVARDFETVARSAWRSIRAQDRYPVLRGRRRQDADRAVTTEWEFVDEVVARALAKFPTPELVRVSLTSDYRCYLAVGQADVARDKAAAERIRAAAAAERETLEARSALAWEETRAAVRISQLEVDERAARIEAIRAFEMEHARAQLASIASPFEELFTQLRSEIAQSAVEMADSVRKLGRVHPNVAERGRRLVDVFDLLATHDDGELRTRLLALRSVLDRQEPASPVPTSQALEALEEVRVMVDRARADFLQGPNRFDMLE